MLVDALGQVVRANKRCYILPFHNTLLDRINMNAEEWLKLSESFGGKFRSAVGRLKNLKATRSTLKEPGYQANVR